MNIMLFYCVQNQEPNIAGMMSNLVSSIVGPLAGLLILVFICAVIYCNILLPFL